MSDNFKMQPVRGVKDIYGNDMLAFKRVIGCAQNIALLNNYKEISTPIFEFSEIFHRTLGETSDVVSKETYTFMDRDKTSITLRPEFTAGIVRSVISNGLTQSLPIKYFSYGPLFRHERPQKGRYRQLHQINFESIGVEFAYSDLELILLANNLLTALGLADDVELQLSTLGDVESRRTFKQKLFEYLSKYESSLSDDNKIRLNKNPLRILDSKEDQDREILVNAPKIYDHLSADSKKRFDIVKEGLSNLNIKFNVNPQIVRGLDYYTHTVFEFTTSKLGSQGTVLGGGRYDGLFEMMGAPSIPAIGFAAGIERLSMLINDKNLNNEHQTLIFLVPIGEAALSKAPMIADMLRKQELAVDYVYHENVSKQMQKANKFGASHVLLFGEEELNNDNYKLKDMKDGSEKLVMLNKLKSYL